METELLIRKRYQVQETLGVGGYGTVLRALDLQLRRNVAIKLPHLQNAKLPHLQNSNDTPAEAQNTEAVRRFQREARALARLRHNGVPQIYDFIDPDDPEGRPVIVMELIEGWNLADILKDVGTLPLPILLAVLHSLAVTIAAAHREEIIHRDLKPENIKIELSGRVVLMDFGCARGTENTTLGVTVASPARSKLIGSLGFLSPEQLNEGEIGPPSDVFCFGSLAYTLATGDNPFVAKKPVDTLANILEANFADPRAVRPDLPSGIVDLLHLVMATDPGQRPTATALIMAIEAELAKLWLAHPQTEVAAWLEMLKAHGKL